MLLVLATRNNADLVIDRSYSTASIYNTAEINIVNIRKYCNVFCIYMYVFSLMILHESVLKINVFILVHWDV